MNIIAPVFAPGAQITPAVEQAFADLLHRLKPVVRQERKPNRNGQFVRPLIPEVQERRQKIVTLHRAGKTMAEMVDILGCNLRDVRNDHNIMSIKANPAIRAQEKRAEERRIVVANLRKTTKMTVREMAAHVATPVGTVRDDIVMLRKRGTI